MAHDVFISYATPDKSTADAVCARLEQNGIRCWIAPRDILPSAPWKPSIVTAIRESRALVLIFSANANQSSEVPKEIDQAVKNGVSIVAFRIENVPPASGLDYELHGRHWLDALTPPLERHIDQLAGTLNALLQRPQSAIAGAPPGAHVKTRSTRFGLIAAAVVLTLAAAGGIGWFVASVSRSDPERVNDASATSSPPPAVPSPGTSGKSAPTPPTASPSTSSSGVERAVDVPASKRGSQPPVERAANPPSSAPPRIDRPRQAVAPSLPAQQPDPGATAEPVSGQPPKPALDQGLAGCWSYKTFLPLLVTITADGKVTGFLEGGRWVDNGNRRYAITWPHSVDTMTLSADGRTFTGINNYVGDRIAVTGRRESGDARSPAGTWQSSNGAPTTFRDDGSVVSGFMPGRWTRNPDGTIRVVWDFAFVDQVTLSPDGRSLSGNNQVNAVTATRAACAG